MTERATGKPESIDPHIPLLHQTSQSTVRSGSISTGPRRRSKLTSGGRWDWSYEKENPRLSKMTNEDQTFGIKFHVVAKYGIFQKRVHQTLSVSVPERTIRISSALKAVIFPTASVSRLTPMGEQSLEIRAAPNVRGKSKRLSFLAGGKKPWTKTFEFQSGANRDEFLNIVRGLNAVGGTVSSVFVRIESVVTPEKLMRGLLAIENEPGYEPPAPKQPLDETEFFRWFLLICQDRDANMLLRRLEEAVLEDADGPSRKTSAATATASQQQHEKRPQASSFSKRGPLFVEPKLGPKESVIIVEDTVTLVAKLDSKEVRHMIGELILTNLRLYFSIYESELTVRPGMTAMNGVNGLARYIGESESERVDTLGSANAFEGGDGTTGSQQSLDRASIERLGQDGFFGKEIKASVPSLRFGRRPDTVFVTVNIFLGALGKVECKHSSLVVETTLGRQCVFQFDRGDAYVASFVERVSEARKTPFFTFIVSEAIQAPSAPIYDPKQEFARQCRLTPHTKFALFDNSGYDLCSTYPSMLIVPAEFVKNTTKMDAVARFRSRARVPAITWAHPLNEVVLSRSSQPLTGIKQAKCVEDEELLAILSSGKRMFVVDARGPAAVAGNQLVRGKGAELPSRYPDVTFLFMGIGNIHTMRSSQEKLALACSPGSFDAERFLQKVEDTKWLMHVRLVLDAATRCAELLELEQASVLVHCSDGWDRTAQLVSLAQMVLDPFFRTIQGLAVLVEKDWVSFGFRFKDRCFGTDEDEKSPIWVQFMDCVFQYRRQFPKHFEFNEDLLVVLAEAPYSGRYATFGYNFEADRAEACRHNKARAWELWTDIQARPELRNAQYEPYEGPLWPNTSAKRMVLWESLYLKHDASTPNPCV